MPASEWTVAQGENIWEIARQVFITQHGGAEPSLQENVQGMQSIIQANMKTLKGGTPGKADLIFPGQEFLVPRALPPETLLRASREARGRIRPVPNYLTDGREETPWPPTDAA